MKHLVCRKEWRERGILSSKSGLRTQKETLIVSQKIEVEWTCAPSWVMASIFPGDASGVSRMIVLGEVPPSQPEQEQESAQDVAAQWLQSEDQKTTATSGPGAGVLAAPSRKKQDVPPVPQPRHRIAKDRPDVRVVPARNRKSRRRRITVAGNHLIHHRHRDK